MFHIHIHELIRKKEEAESRRISDLEICRVTKMSRHTLARLKKYHIKPVPVTTSILEALLDYFECKDINELIEYIPSEKKG